MRLAIIVLACLVSVGLGDIGSRPHQQQRGNSHQEPLQVLAELLRATGDSAAAWQFAAQGFKLPSTGHSAATHYASRMPPMMTQSDRFDAANPKAVGAANRPTASSRRAVLQGTAGLLAATSLQQPVSAAQAPTAAAPTAKGGFTTKDLTTLLRVAEITIVQEKIMTDALRMDIADRKRQGLYIKRPVIRNFTEVLLFQTKLEEMKGAEGIVADIKAIRKESMRFLRGLQDPELQSIESLWGDARVKIGDIFREQSPETVQKIQANAAAAKEKNPDRYLANDYFDFLRNEYYKDFYEVEPDPFKNAEYDPTREFIQQ